MEGIAEEEETEAMVVEAAEGLGVIITEEGDLAAIVTAVIAEIEIVGTNAIETEIETAIEIETVGTNAIATEIETGKKTVGTEIAIEADLATETESAVDVTQVETVIAIDAIDPETVNFERNSNYTEEFIVFV